MSCNKKTDSALKYLKMAIGLKDSLFNREKMIAIQNLTSKDQEKQSEIEAAKIKIAKSNISMYFLIALLVIAIDHCWHYCTE